MISKPNPPFISVLTSPATCLSKMSRWPLSPSPRKFPEWDPLEILPRFIQFPPVARSALFLSMVARWQMPNLKIVCVWPFRHETLLLHHATLQNMIPSFPWIAPHTLHPGTVQGKERIKFCHPATLFLSLSLSLRCQCFVNRPNLCSHGTDPQFSPQAQCA